jgi:hypothetical protein
MVPSGIRVGHMDLKFSLVNKGLAIPNDLEITRFVHQLKPYDFRVVQNSSLMFAT